MSGAGINQADQPKLDWLELRRLSARPKLSEISSEAKLVFGSYYQIGTSEYVMASQQWNPEFTEQAVFVLAFYWASTPAIFRRLVSRDPDAISVDDGTIRTLPGGLMLAPECGSFGAITDYLDANGAPRSQLIEQFDNNWKPSGCALCVERLTYYFRSSAPVPSEERPYGVKLSTSDERWQKLGGV